MKKLFSGMLMPLRWANAFVKYKIDRMRLGMLMRNGLKVGKNVYIQRDVHFDDGYPFLIEIGDDCRISSHVTILAHDATLFRDLGITRLAPVKILEGTFIGVGALILPGVTVGPRAMIAAGCVVNRDIGEDKLAAGNPARPYGSYSELLDEYKAHAGSDAVFDQCDFDSGAVGASEIVEKVRENSQAFVYGVPRADPYYVNTDMNEMREHAERVIAAIRSP